MRTVCFGVPVQRIRVTTSGQRIWGGSNRQRPLWVLNIGGTTIGNWRKRKTKLSELYYYNFIMKAKTYSVCGVKHICHLNWVKIIKYRQYNTLAKGMYNCIILRSEFRAAWCVPRDVRRKQLTQLWKNSKK